MIENAPKNEPVHQDPQNQRGMKSVWSLWFDKLVAFLNGHVDTDQSPTAIHHTLGTGANQAAPGNHGSLAEFDLIKIGAVPDVVYCYGGSITSGTNALTVSDAQFFAWDVGKKIIVCGAGTNELNLETTIASRVSATGVTLAANAGTTVTATEVIYGTDNTATIQAIINANAVQRTYNKAILGPGKRVRLHVPNGRDFMLWGVAGQAYALLISHKDDVEIYGGGKFVFNDCRAIQVEFARFFTCEYLEFDGCQYNKIIATPTYSTAIYQTGTGTTWHDRNRMHTFFRNRIYRVKRGIWGDNGAFSGVGTFCERNEVHVRAVKDSCGIQLTTSDNKVNFNFIENATIGIDASTSDLYECIGNHPYNTGGYNILYATGACGNGASVISLNTIAGYTEGNVAAGLVGTYVKIFSGSTPFAAGGTVDDYYKITAVDSVSSPHTITVAGVAQQEFTTNALTVQSHGMDHCFKIGDATNIADFTKNEFDACFKSHVLCELSHDHRVKINLTANNFLQWGMPNFKFVDYTHTSGVDQPIHGITLKNNAYLNIATGSADNARSVIELTNAVTAGASNAFIGENQCEATTSGYAVTDLSIGGGGLPTGVTQSATHSLDIDTDDSGKLAFRAKGNTDKQKFDLYSWGDITAVNAFRGFKAGGTEASPTSATSGMIPFGLAGNAYHADGTPGYSTVGLIRILTTENTTATNNGGRVAFFTAPNGGAIDNTNPTAYIDHNGDVVLARANAGLVFPDASKQTKAVTLPTNASGVLTNDGSGNLSWGASGSGLTYTYKSTGDADFTAAVDTHYSLLNADAIVVTIPDAVSSKRIILNAALMSGSLSITSGDSDIPATLPVGYVLAIVCPGGLSGPTAWVVEYYGPSRPTDTAPATQASILALLDDESDAPLILRAATNTTKKVVVQDTDGTEVFSTNGEGTVLAKTVTLERTPNTGSTTLTISTIDTAGSSGAFHVWRRGYYSGGNNEALPSGFTIGQLQVQGTVSTNTYDAARGAVTCTTTEQWSGTVGGFTTKVRSRANGTLSMTDSITCHGREIAFSGNNAAVGDSGVTGDGGQYTCYLADENLTAGDVVHFTYNTGSADGVTRTPTSNDRAIGIVYAGVSSGQVAKVVTRGRVAAYFDAAPIKGSIALVDTAATGRLTSSNAPDASVAHWRECGHPTGASVSRESRTLYYIDAHFN